MSWNCCGECKFWNVEDGFCTIRKSQFHADETACSRFRLADWIREERGLPPAKEIGAKRKYLKEHISMLPGMELPKKKK